MMEAGRGRRWLPPQIRASVMPSLRDALALPCVRTQTFKALGLLPHSCPASSLPALMLGPSQVTSKHSSCLVSAQPVPLVSSPSHITASPPPGEPSCRGLGILCLMCTDTLTCCLSPGTEHLDHRPTCYTRSWAPGKHQHPKLSLSLNRDELNCPELTWDAAIALQTKDQNLDV